MRGKIKSAWIKWGSLVIAILALALAVLAIAWQCIGLGYFYFRIESKDLSVILAATIGVIGAGLTAYFSYRSAKKIKFYDSFFEKKSQAYEAFIRTVSVTRSKSFDYEKAVKNLTVARIYCNNELCDVLDNFSAILEAYLYINGLSSSERRQHKDDVKKITRSMQAFRKLAAEIMQEDLANCRKFKFNEPLSNKHQLELSQLLKQ